MEWTYSDDVHTVVNLALYDAFPARILFNLYESLDLLLTEVSTIAETVIIIIPQE